MQYKQNLGLISNFNDMTRANNLSQRLQAGIITYSEKEKEKWKINKRIMGLNYYFNYNNPQRIWDLDLLKSVV